MGGSGAENGASGVRPGPPASSPSNELSLRWKKIEVLGRPVSSIATALAVAAIGFFGQAALKDREAQITQRDAKQQDMRLYTELMTRREQADSDLRTEMFKAILDEFLSDPGGGKAPLSSRLLKLELLALNFGDSLSLSPLFLAVDKEIERPAIASGVQEAKKTIYRDRLRSLARRVSGAQLSALIPSGRAIKLQVPLDELKSGKKYTWPDELAEEEREINGEDNDWLQAKREGLATRTLGGITRSYRVDFWEADTELATVKVMLTITNDDDLGDEQKVPFELNFFNFPMIDSTRLSQDQRFALVLEKFDRKLGHIVATGVIFPGTNASLRDKPFINDIMERLQSREEDPKPEDGRDT